MILPLLWQIRHNLRYKSLVGVVKHVEKRQRNRIFSKLKTRQRKESFLNTRVCFPAEQKTVQCTFAKFWCIILYSEISTRNLIHFPHYKICLGYLSYSEKLLFFPFNIIFITVMRRRERLGWFCTWRFCLFEDEKSKWRCCFMTLKQL